MNKELTPLEAWERVKNTPTYWEGNIPIKYFHTDCCSTIETSLKDYETYKMYTCDEFKEFVYRNDFKSVKNIELAFNSLIKRNQELKKRSEREHKAMQIIKKKSKKEHKVIEIIKKKRVRIGLLLCCNNASQYNHEIELNGSEWQMLTQEEFDLLKEVLL